VASIEATDYNKAVEIISDLTTVEQCQLLRQLFLKEINLTNAIIGYKKNPTDEGYRNQLLFEHFQAFNVTTVGELKRVAPQMDDLNRKIAISWIFNPVFQYDDEVLASYTRTVEELENHLTEAKDLLKKVDEKIIELS
jgi:hypothetical protein